MIQKEKKRKTEGALKKHLEHKRSTKIALKEH